MADDSSKIALSASLADYIGNLRGKLGEVPTEADMVDTRGEATGPAYQYHEALTQLGQSVSKQSSEFLNVLHSIQSWMAESIEELSQTDEEAAAMLRKLQADLEEYGVGLSGAAGGARGGAPGQKAPPAQYGSNGTSADWSL